MRLGFLHWIAVAMALGTVPLAHASFHFFQIEQMYSSADGAVQFIVLHESGGFDGESFLGGHSLTSTRSGMTNSITFPNNLPSTSTAGKRVLIATPGFVALGLGVAPDYMVPNGFLATGTGTLDYAGVDQLMYGSLPTDGINALYRTGAVGQNLATNFADASVSVVPAVASISPKPGIWWNPAESGTGYAVDFSNGVLAMAIYSFLAGGSAQWYLLAGQVTANSVTATLDKYVGGECISCTYTGKPTVVGNDGTITINFTSATSATLMLPGGRVTQIQPFFP